MSDPANEGLQEKSCSPPGTTTYRKYGVYNRTGTNDWFTHTCHADAVAYMQVGCQMTAPAVPPFIEAQYAPMPRDAHPKDYMSGDRKRFFIGTGATAPNAYVRVNRND